MGGFGRGPDDVTCGSKFSKSTEAPERFNGVSEHQGNVLTHLILTDNALQVTTSCFGLWSAPDPDNQNLRASADARESGDGSGKAVAMSAKDAAAIAAEPSDLLLTEFSCDELLGQTCSQEMLEDGHQTRARVSRKVLDMDAASHQEIKCF